MPTAPGAGADDVPRPRADSAAVRLGRTWRDVRQRATTGRLVGHDGPPDDVEHGHLDVLDVLADRDGQRMSELATALGVDPSTATRTMHRMEAAGLARRATDERDGRVLIALLTPRGRRVQARAAAGRVARIDAALAALEPAERTELADLLERFLAALARTTGEAAGPAR